MKKLFIILISLIPSILFAQISIYDIQYNTNAGDGTYPSSYNNQSVTTGGIVTANNFSGGRYFISSSKGGAWNGLFVYDNNYSPAIGDSILITGYISEYQGYTEIASLTAYSVISSGNTLPTAISISTSDVTSEAYEGVFVQVNDCNVTSVFDQYNNWIVNDGSGNCELRPAIYNLHNDFELYNNYPFSSIKGVVGISYGISLIPRSINDIKSASNAFVLITDDKFVENTSSFSYPVKIAILDQTNTISSYSLKMQYDQTKFEYQGFTKTGTISETGSITDDSSIGNIELNFSGSINSDNTSILVYLNFQPLAGGNANLQFNSPTINGTIISYVSAGDMEYGSDECDIPIGDTLTVIQQPLLNIPSIVTEGQEFNIICFAPETTTGWNAEVIFDNISAPVSITQSSYDSDLERWNLTVNVPSVDVYELYDLRVAASGGLVDTVRNAVKVIDQYKDDYYFIHITDLHLLGHAFYGDAGYETDHSEMEDVEEVIKDINILNPEFVLLTGDLINEGELEDFECLRNHTLTIELLEKLEVPVFIVPGNHDLGGWDATPPPQGTARREWWRFFGWRQREIPPTETEYYTHDYSFDYGNVHFTGLEAYDNYDSYMYSVYGAESFISSQLTWLNNDLAAAGDKTKVLFYHYDFKDELNLSTLGVDMALWGHTHSDYNNNTHPYSISTASVCDENRTYRVIRVNNSNLQAESSVRSHSGGDNLMLTYNTANNGSLDLVSATIQNNHNLSFDHGLVKFIMPKSDFGYDVTNGVLQQVLENESTVTCYVEVDIPANGQVTTTVQRKTSIEISLIYDIQYTTVAGDGTYPSSLNNQTINTAGIVTATNYLEGRYFISTSQGGAWNGILVYDNNYSPAIGDSIVITGKVSEYSGYTEIIDLTSFQVISSGNSLPAASIISTNHVGNEEYEGVLVEINDCDVSDVFDENGNFLVNDGTGDCSIRTGIYSLMNDNFTLINGYQFESIKGPIAYHYGVTSIQPRSLNDVQAAVDGFILLTEDKTVDNNTEFTYPVNISFIQPTKEISSYLLQAQYNSEVFQYNGFDKVNTISKDGSIIDASVDGSINLNYTGTTTLVKTDTLVKLKFTALSTGLSNLQFNNSTFNGYDLLFSDLGSLQSTYSTTSIDFIDDNIKLNAYPNPFNNEIVFEYELEKNAQVNISIYNITGQLVKVLVSEQNIPGLYKVKWDATNNSMKKVDEGTYLYNFMVDGKKISAGQMLYIK